MEAPTTATASGLKKFSSNFSLLKNLPYLLSLVKRISGLFPFVAAYQVVAGFSLRTLKGAATLKIQCDTAFTEHLRISFLYPR